MVGRKAYHYTKSYLKLFFFCSNIMMGSIYFNGQLVKEFTTEFPVKNGLKRNKFIGGGVLVLAQQQVNFQFDVPIS